MFAPGRKLPARPAKPGDTNSAQRVCRPAEPPGSLIDSLLRGRFARSVPAFFMPLVLTRRQGCAILTSMHRTAIYRTAGGEASWTHIFARCMCR